MLCSPTSGSAAQGAASPTPDAKAASDDVAKVFTPNPYATLDATHKPLPTTGSWSVQMKMAGEIPAACQSPAMRCVRVIYRVREVGVACTWTVGFVWAATPQPGDGAARRMRWLIVDEDANAALYTLKKAWVEGDAPAHAIVRSGASYPSTAGAPAGGIVAVLLVVGPDGKVRDARAKTGPLMLQGVAVQAAREWRFEPLTVGSQHTSFQTYAMFNFKPGRSVSIGMGPDEKTFWPGLYPH